MTYYDLWFRGPLGHMRLIATEAALAGMYLSDHEGGPEPEAEPGRDHPVLLATRAQLDEYFTGRRTTFDLPLDPLGTEFQRAVWRALCEIPFGETRSYKALATSIGRPQAMRAVGAANGRNPISIIVPCHRVIGADGSLVGYAAGTERKKWLLHHEQAVLSRELFPPAPYRGE
ncbi:MAG TPA: methylated-DNA--[protein]-cysteine S-methyltransferase [Polyangia bacterium]|jgi:methylated-DNA-[protein]-cysteine S-methyltransferase|nr:methylated-DNA--[protein]-cysteine S-methyltransferase [Polyangia bacterium]